MTGPARLPRGHLHHGPGDRGFWAHRDAAHHHADPPRTTRRTPSSGRQGLDRNKAPDPAQIGLARPTAPSTSREREIGQTSAVTPRGSKGLTSPPHPVSRLATIALVAVRANALTSTWGEDAMADEHYDAIVIGDQQGRPVPACRAGEAGTPCQFLRRAPVREKSMAGMVSPPGGPGLAPSIPETRAPLPNQAPGR